MGNGDSQRRSIMDASMPEDCLRVFAARCETEDGKEVTLEIYLSINENSFFDEIVLMRRCHIPNT